MKGGIREISERLKNGELTVKELCQYYLERIERIDKKGPSLNSIIEVNPDALDLSLIHI